MSGEFKFEFADSAESRPRESSDAATESHSVESGGESSEAATESRSMESSAESQVEFAGADET